MTTGLLWNIFAANEDHDHDTDGMIALLPRDPQQWVIPGGDPPEDLHVTIQYFADAAVWDPTFLQQTLDTVSGQYPEMTARVMGHATFNPDGGMSNDKDPCAVYLISDCPVLADFATEIQNTFPSPEAHRPFLPHMTCGYGLVAGQLSMTGPVVFDRVLLSLGGKDTVFPLRANSGALAL